VKRLILATIAFTPGVFLLVKSYSPSYSGPFEGMGRGERIDPLFFVLGLAACIVTGAVLIKAIRDYLK